MTRLFYVFAPVLVSLSAACTTPATLVQPGPVRVRADLTATEFVVLPAIDQRTDLEREGTRLGIAMRFVGPGAAATWAAGGEVSGDDAVYWVRNAFTGQATNASTMIATDLGQVLARSTGRRVRYEAASAASVAAMRLPEGAVVVVPVIDHLTKVSPQTRQFMYSRTETSTHVVTTTSSSWQKTGATWNVMLRLHVYQMRGGKLRHVVRYASGHGSTTRAYSRAIQNAARQAAL